MNVNVRDVVMVNVGIKNDNFLVNVNFVFVLLMNVFINVIILVFIINIF